MMQVKICGLQEEASIELALSLGVDAIGFNLVRTSPRWVDVQVAQRLASYVRGRALVVVVVADPLPQALVELLQETSFDRIQLHGDEMPHPDHPGRARLWKAVRLRHAEDVEHAAALPVDAVLVDATSTKGLGGTGEQADWSLASRLAARRNVWLAGGLRPDNVALAIETVRPFGVDVASGVEQAPGIKDPDKLAAFVRAAKGQVR